MNQIYLSSFPIRKAKRNDKFFLFNTKTFNSIYLNQEAMNIYNKICQEKVCNLVEINKYAQKQDIDSKEIDELIMFLKDNEFIQIK